MNALQTVFSTVVAMGMLVILLATIRNIRREGKSNEGYPLPRA